MSHHRGNEHIDFVAELGHLDGYRMRYEELIDELRKVLAKHRPRLAKSFGVHELYMHMRNHGWLREVDDGVDVQFEATQQDGAEAAGA